MQLSNYSKKINLKTELGAFVTSTVIKFNSTAVKRVQMQFKLLNGGLFYNLFRS